jgi:hypothetical protein
MAFKKNEIFELSKNLVAKHKLIFIADLISLLPCSESTFYNFFPAGSKMLDDIHEIINNNRVTLKVSMRNKWYKSNSPVLQLGLYKLLATPEELKALSMSHTDITTKGNEIQPSAAPVIVFTKGAKDESKDQ